MLVSFQIVCCAYCRGELGGSTVIWYINDYATSMIPCEIEPEVVDRVEGSLEHIDWDTMYQSLGTIRLHLKRFNQVLQTIDDKECTNGMFAYIDDLLTQISTLC